MHSVNNVHRKAEAIDIVINRQLQWRIDAAFLFVAAYVDVFVVSPSISHSMNQLRIAMKVEDDRLVHREQRIKISVQEAVRVLGIGLELEKIDDVDKPDFEVWKFRAKHRGRGQGLLGGNVSSRSHHYIRLTRLVIAGPVPDAHALMQWMMAFCISKYCRCFCLSLTITF